MDRRKSIKLMAWGAVGSGILVEACKNSDKKNTIDKAAAGDPDAKINRMPEEEEAYKKITAETFFTPHEMATIAILSDIIIPKDDISGSATDAKVPDFIEFIVKDKPEFQVPMRGGLRWLDMESAKRFGQAFKDSAAQQQIQIVDDIAYPEIEYKDAKGNKIKKGSVKPGMKQGIAFFSLMRNLTATGFYTSPIGVKDIGYMGNTPNQWKGVPDEVLKQYGLAYTGKELKECV
jgi:gluconate 2-dehydrogenase gamma chain